MSTNGRMQSRERSVTSSFSELTHDCIELAELQTQLLALDIKETSRSQRMAALLLIAAVCTLLGTVPVGLIAVGELLVEQAGWSHALSYAISTLGGIALSMGLMLAAYMRFRTGISALGRSREELSRNVAWIKSSLRDRTTWSATAGD